MQLIFPTQTYSFHQRKISTYSPQNVDKILLQCKTSTYGPQNVEEILHQRKTSTYGPQNVEGIPHQQHTKKRAASTAALHITVGKILVVHLLKVLN